MDPLARLIAIDEIQQLKSRYFRMVDTRDWKGLESIFTHDGMFDATEAMKIYPLDGPPVGDTGIVSRGNRTIAAWIANALAEHTSVHHGHCHEVTIDSDTTAHGVIAMVDTIRLGDRTTQVFRATGHYWETYRHEDGAWRIATTKLTRLTNDVELAFSAPAVEA